MKGLKRDKDTIRKFSVKSQVGNEKVKSAKKKNHSKCRPLWHFTMLCISGVNRSNPRVLTLHGVEIQSTAERLAKDLKIENYSASCGWLWRFRNRHGLRNRKMCGEALSANKGSGEHFRQELCLLIDAELQI